MSPDSKCTTFERKSGDQRLGSDKLSNSNDFESGSNNDSNYDFIKEENEARITKSDGTIVFSYTETHTGKIKTDLHHEEYDLEQNQPSQSDF